MEGEEVEIGGVELELVERAPGEEQVRQWRATPGDGRLQPLHHVPGQGEGAFLEPAPASERLGLLQLQRGQVPGALRPQQRTRAGGGLGQRGGGVSVGLPVVEEGEGEVQTDEDTLVLVPGDGELVEEVPEAEGGVGNPPPVGQGEVGAGRRLLGLQRAKVGTLLHRRRRSHHPEAGSEEAPGLIGGGEGPAGDAHRLPAEEERGGEPFPLLAQVGAVLLCFQHRPVDVEPGDVTVGLAFLLQLRQPLGVGHRPFQGGDPELGGGDLRDALQEVEEALAEQLQGIERRRVPRRAKGTLPRSALPQLHQLAEGEGVVGDVGQLVEAGRIGGPDGEGAPLEVEARVGKELGAEDVGARLADAGARGDQVRRPGPEDRDEIRIGGKG